MGAWDTIKRERPVIAFEWEPDVQMERWAVDPVHIISTFKKLDYVRVTSFNKHEGSFTWRYLDEHHSEDVEERVEIFIVIPREEAELIHKVLLAKL